MRIKWCSEEKEQLSRSNCIFSSTVQSYVIQGQCITTRRKFEGWKETIHILSGSTKYLVIDGYLYDNECVRAWVRACVRACVRASSSGSIYMRS